MKKCYKCAICRVNQSDLKRNLSIDHDHNTGKVRGLLCPGCNIGIGGLKHDIEILKSAILYLEKYN